MNFNEFQYILVVLGEFIKITLNSSEFFWILLNDCEL